MKRKLLYIFLLLHFQPIYADESLIAINGEISQINEIQQNESKLLAALLDVFPEANDVKISESSIQGLYTVSIGCLLYTSPSPRDLSTSRMPSSA